MIGRATIRVGDRGYFEYIDLDAEYRQYEEDRDAWGEWESWRHRIRRVKVDEDGLKTLSGNHLLFGWVEAIFQSDQSPFSCLTMGQPRQAEWTYEFEVIDDY